MTATLNDNPATGRFEMQEAGHTLFADYRRTAGRLYIDHVEAPEALRGTGAAGRLMAAIAERARNEDEEIVPICGYAAAWLRRNKQD